MTALAEAQRLLASAIDGPAGSHAAAAVAGLASGPGTRASLKRVAVYRDSSRRARAKALENLYPVCRQILGARCFHTVAMDYVAARPSTAPDLNLYGTYFPELLVDLLSREQAFAALPYLSDLARLEYCWHASYYADRSPAFDFERFSALVDAGRADDVRFHLGPDVHLLASEFPVHEIWRRHREGTDTSEVRGDAGDRLVVYRPDLHPVVRPVPTRIFRLLEVIAGGATLQAAVEAGAPVDELPRLLQAGWIAEFTLSDQAG